jgi:hypothetical protein
VTWINRMNVEERERCVVLINLVARQFVAHYFAKNTIRHTQKYTPRYRKAHHTTIRTRYLAGYTVQFCG